MTTRWLMPCAPKKSAIFAHGCSKPTASKRQAENRTAAFVCINTDEATVGDHDLACQRETDARSLFPGCEKRHKYFCRDVRRDARPIVCHLDDDIVPAIEVTTQAHDRF